MKAIFESSSECITAMFCKWKLPAHGVSLLVLLFASFAGASQSSIDQKSGFNSLRQLSLITSGSWGIDDKSFATGAFAYQRTPTATIGSADTFYQGAIGFGYGIDNLAFDVGFTYAQAPLQQITSLGGSFGLTYIVIPGDADAAEYKDQALGALHSQIYVSEEEQAPLFWVRFGYNGNSMKSDLVEEPNASGKETALSVDFYVPYSKEFLFNFGVGFHAYDASSSFYDYAFRGSVTSEQQLLQSTIQGLPRSNIALGMVWQLAPFDALLPRYQATEIDSSRLWAHSLDLGWRHQFTKNWFINPTYEISNYQTSVSSAVVLEAFYVF